VYLYACVCSYYFFFVFNYICLLKRLSNVYIFLTHFLLFHLYYGLCYLLLFIYFSFGFLCLLLFFSLIDLLCANCSSFFLVDLPSSLSLHCLLSSPFFIYYYYDQHHLVTLLFFVSRLRPLVREEERGKKHIYMYEKRK